jgi:hypothetical protein
VHEIASRTRNPMPRTTGDISALAMQTTCWASVALILSCAGAAGTPATAPTARCAGTTGSTAATVNAAQDTSKLAPQLVDIATPSGKKLRIPVQGDQYVRPDAGVDVQVIAEVGSSVVVIDTYLSRPGGGSYCQAGEERSLRILRVDGEAPQVTLNLKLASCWQEIELANPGVEWSAADSTLKVRWLLGPTSKMQPEELTLKLKHQ